MMDRIEEIRKIAASGRPPRHGWGTEVVLELLSHISSLEKRVEAQRKVVEAAKEAVKWELPDFNSLEDLSDALREMEE